LLQPTRLNKDFKFKINQFIKYNNNATFGYKYSKGIEPKIVKIYNHKKKIWCLIMWNYKKNLEKIEKTKLLRMYPNILDNWKDEYSFIFENSETFENVFIKRKKQRLTRLKHKRFKFRKDSKFCFEKIIKAFY